MPMVRGHLNPSARGGEVETSMAPMSWLTAEFVRCNISRPNPASSFLKNQPGSRSLKRSSSPMSTAPPTFTD